MFYHILRYTTVFLYICLICDIATVANIWSHLIILHCFATLFKYISSWSYRLVHPGTFAMKESENLEKPFLDVSPFFWGANSPTLERVLATPGHKSPHVYSQGQTMCDAHELYLQNIGFSGFKKGIHRISFLEAFLLSPIFIYSQDKTLKYSNDLACASKILYSLYTF